MHQLEGQRLWGGYTTTTLLALALAASAASASIVNNMSANSTTGIGGLTSWPSAPATPSAPPTILVQSTPASFTIGENNYGGASLFSLAQSFKVPAGQGGQIRDIQIAISGNAGAGVSFNVALYDALSQPVGNSAGSANYTVGTNVSNNLLTNNIGQTWGGYTLSGATAGVLDFSFTGADSVNLVAGNSYIFEISATTNPNAMVWYRSSNGPYADG